MSHQTNVSKVYFAGKIYAENLVFEVDGNVNIAQDSSRCVPSRAVAARDSSIDRRQRSRTDSSIRVVPGIFVPGLLADDIVAGVCRQPDRSWQVHVLEHSVCASGH